MKPGEEKKLQREEENKNQKTLGFQVTVKNWH